MSEATFSTQKISSIAKFLRNQALNSKAKFFLLKSNKELKAVHFDVNKLETPEGIKFIQYLLKEEEKGSKILISDPYRGLKKVSFVKNYNVSRST